MDNDIGGAALTAFENTASKPMQKILQTLRERAAEATPADRSMATALRAAGRGIRKETISPAAAAIIVLMWNQFNRHISITKVDQMVADLKSGDWRIHHQGIAFTPDGDLADGQHRLVACALSGVAMTTVVASDFDMNAIDAIDRSTRRTLTQVLQMRGIPDAQAKVRVGKTVVQMKYRIDYEVATPNFSEHRLSHELRKIDKILTDGISLGKLSTRNVSDPAMDWDVASVVATLLLMSNWDEDLVTSFLVSVQEGIATYENAPTILLSRILTKSRDKKDSLDKTSCIALSLKAAKLFAEAKHIGRLTWNERQEGIPNPALTSAKADTEGEAVSLVAE